MTCLELCSFIHVNLVTFLSVVVVFVPFRSVPYGINVSEVVRLGPGSVLGLRSIARSIWTALPLERPVLRLGLGLTSAIALFYLLVIIIC